MTYIAHLDPNFIERAEAQEATFADVFPDWQEREDDPERFVPEAEWNAATDADFRDLEVIRDWEAFGGFHNP
jgi:hypothetical protein